MYSIEVKNISKAYKCYPNKFSRLKEWFSIKKKLRHELKWVLTDISFNVSPGEAVGIVGMNGAGKSTLLKIITGTTSATKGTVVFKGKVAALLELGMGFHGDFTGRQNVYMAGQLLGLTLDEINILMPEIESFAEIGDYIDQPVRVYSSGMMVRLAFSVATAVRPDILIVDEALSVGDAYFQHKSFERIKEFRKSGTTLLLVSHDKGAVQAVCDRAILLVSGNVEIEGKPEVVMDYYNAKLADRNNETLRQTNSEDGKVQTVSGTKEAIIESIFISNKNDKIIETAKTGELIKLKVKVRINQNIDDLVLGFVIKDRLGQEVFGINSHRLQKDLQNIKEGSIINFTYNIPINLGGGNYSISAALHSGDSHIIKNYEWRDLAVVFNVINVDKVNFVGSTYLPVNLDISYE